MILAGEIYHTTFETTVLLEQKFNECTISRYTFSSSIFLQNNVELLVYFNKIKTLDNIKVTFLLLLITSQRV